MGKKKKTTSAAPARNPLWEFFDPTDESGGDSHCYFFYDEKLISKINVAIAIGRPLLLTGEAGVGKTAVARGVALVNQWTLIKEVVKSRTDASDLKFRFDGLRRLNDAQRDEDVKDPEHYVEPGAIWRAFNPESARKQAEKYYADKGVPAHFDEALKSDGRVLLLDEIDKAEMELPNDLLDAFDEGTFDVPYINRDESLVKSLGRNLLIVITSNDEKDLSGPFYRRCITHKIMAPSDADAMLKIGHYHQNDCGRGESPVGTALVEDDLKRIIDGIRRPEDDRVNVSEYVDIIDASRKIVDKAGREHLQVVFDQLFEMMRERRENVAALIE